MKRFVGLALVSSVVLVGSTAVALAAGDAVKGGKVFNKCKACHSLEAGKNKVGPSLRGIVGRQAGTVEGYKYSKINQAAGNAGLVWTEEAILDYLPDPNAFLKKHLTDNGKGDQAKGRTKMTFKLKKEQDRVDVIEFLKTQTN